nr:NADH dehydrogenase subunit 5 [Perna canaliculus]QPD06651.1 NADH dehydrogenase subunit 5 [Perna canaliculus]
MSLMVMLGYVLVLLSSFVESVYFFEFMLWDLNSLSFSVNLLLDSLSMMFLGTILIISGSVLMYCYWYMDDEKNFYRFMYLVYLFVGSMMFMILIPNLVTLLIGWDGLGLTSFLLVAHYQNNKSLSGSLLTALTNRIGDGLILASISLWAVNESGWVLYNFESQFVNFYFILALIFGGMTKSAQMPFCAWLPAAMAAPTPVSSLVHSSTLVTAGVYLLIRSYPVIKGSLFLMTSLKFLSLFTLVLASSVAINCFDMKKIIALSTLSQLSVMMFSLSHGLVSISFFHLVMHALFKALLFLTAGAVIHSLKGCQDIRSMGGCWSILPSSMVCMFIANCSLSGLPFMSGFYSKDMILDLMFNSSVNFWCFMIIMPGLMLTSFYSMRMVWMVCFGSNKVSISTLCLKEPKSLLIPYSLLAVGAVFLGGVLTPMSECLFSYRSSSASEMGTLGVLFVFGISYVGLISVSSKFGKDFRGLFSFLFSMWFLELLTHGVKKCFFDVSGTILKSCDKGMLETVGPKGLYSFCMKLSSYNENFQSDYFLKGMLFFSSFFIGALSFLFFWN